MRISAFITATPKYYSKLRIYEANYYSNTNFAECSFKHLDCLQSLRAFDLFFIFKIMDAFCYICAKRFVFMTMIHQLIKLFLIN